jgi:hypothetical protein
VGLNRPCAAAPLAPAFDLRRLDATAIRISEFSERAARSRDYRSKQSAAGTT